MRPRGSISSSAKGCGKRVSRAARNTTMSTGSARPSWDTARRIRSITTSAGCARATSSGARDFRNLPADRILPGCARGPSAAVIPSLLAARRYGRLTRGSRSSASPRLGGMPMELRLLPTSCRGREPIGWGSRPCHGKVCHAGLALEVASRAVRALLRPRGPQWRRGRRAAPALADEAPTFVVSSDNMDARSAGA